MMGLFRKIVFFFAFLNIGIYVVYGNTYKADVLIAQLDSLTGSEKAEKLIEIAQIYENSKTASAYEFMQKAQKYSLSIDYHIGVAKSLVVKASLLYKRGVIEEAETTLEEALKIAEFEKDQATIALVLHALGNYHNSIGNNQKAISYFLKSLEISELIEDKYGIATTQNMIGNHYMIKGEYKVAEIYHLKALNLAREINDSALSGEVLYNIGVIYMRQGNFKKAFSEFIEAIALKDAVGDRVGVASIYNNMGDLFLQKQEYEKALDYFKKSLEINKELDLKNRIAVNYNNIGVANNELGKLKTAMEYFRKAKEINTLLNSKKNLVENYNNIGIILLKEGRLNEVMEHLQLSKKLAEEIEFKYGLVICYEVMGNLYSQQRNTRQAILSYQTALKLAEHLDAHQTLQNIYEELAAAYYLQGNYQDAYNYHLKFSSLRDSIQKEVNNRQMAEMEAKYQAKKNEKEIEILTKARKIKDLEYQKDHQRQQTQNYFLLIGIAFIAMAAIALFRRNVERKKSHLRLEITNNNLAIRNEEIAQKNKEITDSIKYAQRIQRAILPQKERILKFLPDSFVFYMPKDIVSGDFYWFEKNGDDLFIAVADCTGHGVPGAFMSIVGNNKLNQAILELGIKDTGKILDHLNKSVAETLHQNHTHHVHDGMDISLCKINYKTQKMEFSGGFNSIYMFRDNEFSEIRADRFSIGIYASDPSKRFTTNTIDIEKGDVFYLFTDGYADQFGGDNGKKLKYKPFKQILEEVQNKRMNEQKAILYASFVKWMGEHEQVDDVCVIGIRI